MCDVSENDSCRLVDAPEEEMLSCTKGSFN